MANPINPKVRELLTPVHDDAVSKIKSWNTTGIPIGPNWEWSALGFEFAMLHWPPGFDPFIDQSTSSPKFDDKLVRITGTDARGTYEAMNEWRQYGFHILSSESAANPELIIARRLYDFLEGLQGSEVWFWHFDKLRFPNWRWPTTSQWDVTKLGPLPQEGALSFILPTLPTFIPLFTPLPPRKPRKWGRAWTPKWEAEHAKIVAARKFTRNTARMKRDPNAGRFGRKDTSQKITKTEVAWNAKQAAERVLVDAAKAAAGEAKRRIVGNAKRAAAEMMKKAILKRLNRYRK